MFSGQDSSRDPANSFVSMGSCDISIKSGSIGEAIISCECCSAIGESRTGKPSMGEERIHPTSDIANKADRFMADSCKSSSRRICVARASPREIRSVGFSFAGSARENVFCLRGLPPRVIGQNGYQARPCSERRGKLIGDVCLTV